MIGTLLKDRYRIDAKLGEGGMGVVYKAHDTTLDRPVAIKTLSPHLLGEEGLKRLLREAQSAAKLSHPNIVAIHDVIDEGDARMIVMEYVAGRPLRDLLPLPWAEAVDIAGQVCLGLDYAHAQGVVHRDIKPENIVITASGVAKIMDFGLARSEGRSRLTQAGMIVGTVAYMAPEQALSGRTDGRSDLYSLGAVLYETITGKPPFAADDPIAVISMHVNVPPVSPRFYRPDTPAVLESVVLRLLAKDPTERYASAEELARVLKTAPVSVESPEHGAPAPDVRPATPSLFDMMTRGRLIDREEQLGSLKGALESMLSGRGQVVLIAGEPGIGKTRLAEELLVYARLRGCLALVGHGYEQEVNIPYLPVAEALRTAARTLARDRLSALAGPYAAELVKLLPELAQRIPDITPSPPLEPDQERLRLYDTLTRFFTELARAQPLVLMLDDLHWADAGTLQLVRYLARNIRAERLLIVGTYRDVELDPSRPLAPALSEMNRERLYTRVLVRGLTRQHVASMIQSVFQDAQPVSDEFSDLIYRETEGNPFFVEEVLKHLIEVGALYIEDGRWQRKPIQELDVPQSVREVIGRRILRVSEPCQRALSLAAVVGRRFQFEVLQAVGELGEPELLEALEEAIAAQLIREKGMAAEEEEYDFTHTLIRDVLYERLSLRRRRMLHQRAGEALERLYAGRIEEVVEDLAHHFTRAPQGDGLNKAIRYSLDAARKSMNVFAHEEAVRYYRNAVELLEEAGDERRVAETHLGLGEPLVHLANAAEAVGAYERALGFYERRGNPGDVARVHRLIGRAFQRDWNFQAAIPHLETALENLPAAEHVADLIEIHVDLARANFFSGEIDEAERHATQALLLTKARSAPAVQVDAYATLGLVAMLRGDFDGATGHYREAIKIAREMTVPGGHFGLIRSIHNMALAHEQRGQYAEARRQLLQALDVARRARHVEQISFINFRLSQHDFWRGDWVEAKRYIVDNVERQPLSSIRRLESRHMLSCLDGEWEAAASLAGDVVEHHRQKGNLTWASQFGGWHAWHNLELGQIREAFISASEVAAFAERIGGVFAPPTHAFVLEGLARGGALQRCEALCAKVEAVRGAVDTPYNRTSALLGRAAVALERGDREGGARLLEECLLAAERSGPVLHAYVLRKLGRVLIERRGEGDLERARHTLQECLTLLEQMGDARKAEQVRAELRALG